MSIEQEVQGEVEASIRKGKYPDRGSAIVGLQKQLIEYQKGALKDQLKDVDPVSTIESKREETWKELVAKADGDEEKAAQLYAGQLKKIVE